MKSLSIVVAVFNQVHFSKRCFESLIKGATRPHSMVVIDNASIDETPSFLHEFKSTAEKSGWRIDVISNPKNVGVGAAWNQGIKHSSSDYVAILNNDTWLMPGWDETLLQSALKLNADMIGPFYDENPFDQIKTPLRAQSFIKRNRDKYSKEWVSILMLFRRATFEKIGFFDERFFITYEDRDIRERMERAGLSYFKTGSCFIWHHSKGTRDSSDVRPGYEQESLAKFIEKWGFDPRVQETARLYRYQQKWTRLKNRFGYF